MGRWTRFEVAAVAAVTVLVLAVAAPAASQGLARNVIVMVPDGCSQSVVTAARWYKGEPLHVDRQLRGLVKTWMSDSIITDSAAAGTAFATGYKTSDGFVGMGPRFDTLLSTMPTPPAHMEYKPLATVLEGARLTGRATGLIATSRITHATPAAFAAHVEDRGWDNEIMEQMVYGNVDVAFGGGGRHLIPTAQGGKRTDGEDLKQELIDRGYQFVENRDQMMGLSSGKAWGMFASSHMEAELDRTEFAPSQPSLAEMTAKAIELLSADPDGFFLMVEGSQIDWAGHANDPIYMITDFLAFDDAFKVALDFAVENGETLVLAFPDHNTGGMTVGNWSTSATYTAVTTEQLIAPLADMKLTAYGVARKIGSDTSTANIRAQIATWWGLDVTEDDVQAILEYQAAAGVYLDYAISAVVSDRYTIIGWTTHGHNGEDVPLWARGPGGPTGLVDNTFLARRAAMVMGFDLAVVDQLLFCDVASYLPTAQLDTTDPSNPVLRAGDVSFPVGKDIAVIESLGLQLPLPGVVVHVPATGKVFMPMLGIAVADALSTAATRSVADLDELVEKRLAALARDAGIASHPARGPFIR